MTNPLPADQTSPVLAQGEAIGFAIQALKDAREELRLIRMKDCAAVYDPVLRAATLPLAIQRLETVLTSPSTRGEQPVAWQERYRICTDGEWSAWSPWEHRSRPGPPDVEPDSDYQLEIRSLYADPPMPEQAEVERLTREVARLEGLAMQLEAEAGNSEVALAAERTRCEALREAHQRIINLDEAMGHNLNENHAFEAVEISRSALSVGEAR